MKAKPVTDSITDPKKLTTLVNSTYENLLPSNMGRYNMLIVMQFRVKNIFSSLGNSFLWEGITEYRRGPTLGKSLGIS